MILPNKNNTAIVFKHKNSDGYNYLTITLNNFDTYKNDLLNSTFKDELLDLINGLNKQVKEIKKIAKFFTSLSVIDYLPGYEDFNSVSVSMDLYNVMAYTNDKINFLKDFLSKLEK